MVPILLWISLLQRQMSARTRVITVTHDTSTGPQSGTCVRYLRVSGVPPSVPSTLLRNHSHQRDDCAWVPRSCCSCCYELVNLLHLTSTFTLILPPPTTPDGNLFPAKRPRYMIQLLPFWKITVVIFVTINRLSSSEENCEDSRSGDINP